MEQFPDLNKYQNIHFIGVGGVSMSSLAVILAKRGKNVTGSDNTRSATTDMLIENGVDVTIGHYAENAKNADLVVYTAAIKDNNPEMVYAKENGIKMIERAVLLGMLMSTYSKSIAVSGTHGKSTTTSMISSILLETQFDPTILIGAHFNRIGSNYKVGCSDFAVYEACEYVNSFHHFYPNTAVILNIDADHLDFFKDIESIKESFDKFTDNIDANGVIVINGDNKNCKDIITNNKRRIISFGLNKSSDCYADNIRLDHGHYVFDAYFFGEYIGSVRLLVIGEHNIYNALASIAVCKNYGISNECIIKGIEKFTGASRRFEIVAYMNDAEIVSDYAHHPTEISATIKAAKSANYSKVTVCFQPHTYTRTKLLQNEFIEALKLADKVVLTDIYSAREINTIGANVMEIVNAIDNAEYISKKEDIAEFIKSNAKSNEVYILMGAGDINKVSDLL